VHAALGNDLAVEVGQLSSSQTSSISSGPRGPAVLLFWLSTTGAPKAVVIGVTGSSPCFCFGVVLSSRCCWAPSGRVTARVIWLSSALLSAG
jgi:hypothetical protein